MQFQVPQFIEVEDKIFGPLTFKQFIYLAGGAGSAYLVWRLLPIYIAGPIALALLGGAAAFAFLQFNGRPFIVSVENAFYFILHPRLYLWNNEQKTRVAKKKVERGERASDGQVYVPHLSESKLHELAWSLDIKERVAEGMRDEDVGESERVAAARKVTPIRTMRSSLAE